MNNTQGQTHTCQVCGEQYVITNPPGLEWLGTDQDGRGECPECRSESIVVILPADPMKTMFNAWIRRRGRLTTRHSASSYGKPVVVVDGEAYGPADVLGVGRETYQDTVEAAVRLGYPREVNNELIAAIDEYANRVRELIVRHKLNEKKEDADHKS